MSYGMQRKLLGASLLALGTLGGAVFCVQSQGTFMTRGIIAMEFLVAGTIVGSGFFTQKGHPYNMRLCTAFALIGISFSLRVSLPDFVGQLVQIAFTIVAMVLIGWKARPTIRQIWADYNAGTTKDHFQDPPQA